MKQKTHLLAQVAMSPGRGATSSTPRSPRARTTVSGRRRPSRSTSSRSTSSAAWNWKSIASRRAVPLTARTRSCARRPAVAASLPGRTAATTTPFSAEVQPLMRLLALGILGGVEEPHALHEVLQAGDQRERGGEPEQRRGHALHAPVVSDKADEHGQDLEERRPLAEPRGP